MEEQSPQSLIFILIVLCFTKENNSVAGCGMLLTAQSGTFQSPRYPDADDNWTCRWKISMPLNTKIEVFFDDFDLLDIFCCTDKLEVLENEVNLGSFTGNTLNRKTIISVGNEVTVILKTCSPSLFFDRRGIKVSYTTSFPTTRERFSTAAITNKGKQNFVSRGILTTTLPKHEIQTILPSSTQPLHTTNATLKEGFSITENGVGPSDRYLPKYVLAVSSAGFIIVVVIISAKISEKKKQETLSRSQQTDRSSDDLGTKYVITDIDISKDSQANSALAIYERNIVFISFDENYENSDYEVFYCKV